MRLTSKGRYAVRAMLDLTFNSKGRPVRLQEISSRQAISLHYLEQLFRKLRTSGVVKSVRGPGGGYILSRDMDEISMRDILESVGENINPARDILGAPSSGVEKLDNAGQPIKVETNEFNLTKNFFLSMGTIMEEYLTTTTLGDMKRKLDQDAINTPEATNSVINNIATPSIESNANANNANEYVSVIRPNIGEVNQ